MTDNCETCRFWSMMIARKGASDEIEALCINDHSSHCGHYMLADDRCDRFAAGDPIDGEDIVPDSTEGAQNAI